jgi:hypothetical protein
VVSTLRVVRTSSEVRKFALEARDLLADTALVIPRRPAAAVKDPVSTTAAK